PQARQPKPSPAPAAVLAPASSPKPQAPSTQQLGELFNQVKQSGWTTEQFKADLSETYNLGSSRELTMDQFHQVQRDLQTVRPSPAPVTPLTQSVNRSADSKSSPEPAAAVE